MGQDCTYCDSDVSEHDPVFVAEGADRTPAGQFCNYACLTAWVEREGLETGACCTWSPTES